MKTLVKKFAKATIAALLFVMIFGTANKLQAQTHVKAAANCILHDAYVKEASKTKNAVSCVDCYCKVCGDKKAKEKEAKNKGRELADKQNLEKRKLANEKTLAEQTKKAEIERAKAIQKAKENEAILVAPKPKVVKQNKVATVKLSAKDQEIFELAKKRDVRISGLRDYNGNGKLFFMPDLAGGFVNTSEPTGRIFYEENNQIIILKDLRLKDNASIGYNYDSKLDENGNFCLNFGYNDPAHISQSDGKDWADIVTLEGENLLNDKTIDKVTYKGNGIYELQKRGEKTPTLQYNFKTKRTTPIQ